MNILLPTTRYSHVAQYVCRDLAQAYKSLGHNAVVLKEPYDGGRYPKEAIAEFIRGFNPDVCIGFSHGRWAVSPFLPKNVRHVAWVWDTMDQWRLSGCIEHVLPEDKVYVVEDETIGAWIREGNIYTHGTIYPGYNHFIYYPVPRPPRPVITVLANRNQPQKEMPPRMFEVMSSRHEALIQKIGALVSAGLSVELWGRGWETSPYAPMWRGVVTPGKRLANVYRDSAVVLSIGLRAHPRILEAGACGAMVVASGPARDDPFPLDTFDTHEELVEACTKALAATPEERARYSHVASSRLLQSYTMVDRAMELLAE